MTTDTQEAAPPVVRAPRGPQRTCKTWGAEAAMRLLMNNLDPDVAEDPARLVVYGGSGKAARDWRSYHAIVKALTELAPDFPLPQRELANHLNVTRETVNRLLQDWRNEGLIAIDRGVFVLKDVGRLERLAEGA